MDGGSVTLDDLADLITKSNQEFEQFKTVNDDRLKQIETKGSADVLTEEKVDRINKDLGDTAAAAQTALTTLKKIADDEDAANEDREKREKILVDRLDGLETAFKRSPRGGSDNDSESPEMKGAAALYTYKEERILSPDEIATKLEAYNAYVAAFGVYIRKSNHPYGQDLPTDIQKALSVGIEADGGYWVIPEISNQIKTRQFETSPIRGIAQVVTIGTDAIEFPTDTNDATSGGWVGETDSRAETATPQTGTGRISVHEQFANPRATQKLLDDAQFPVETWLANKIGDKLGRVENLAFVTGVGVNQPRGFMNYSGDAVTTADSAPRAWGTLQYTFSTDASSFAGTDPGDDLIDMVFTLNPAYRAGAQWVMNRATVAEIRKFKDGQGNYLWTAGNITQQQASLLIGYPITEAEDMPDVAANAYPIAFGNFNEGYMIVDRQGIRTLRDPFSAKPFVQFYTTKRVGGDVVNFDAIKLFKIATS